MGDDQKVFGMADIVATGRCTRSWVAHVGCEVVTLIEVEVE